MKKILLEDIFKKLVNFLNEGKFDYIIIGGIAAGVLGEPRVTGDVDVDIILDRNDIGEFLNKAKRAGFNIDKEKCIRRANERGIFQIYYGDYHIDFIITSIDLEKEAIKRKKIVRLYGLKTSFPTPEDFILLKIIPGRPQDLIDAEKVVIRYKNKLDINYLIKWAQRLSDEAEDMRIYNTLKEILEK